MPLLLATNALGTRVELLLDAPESPALRAAGEEALAEVRLWHDRLSRFQSDSFLAHIHRAAHARAVPLDDDLWSLFTLCARVHIDSGGAFDPTAAPVPPDAEQRGDAPPSAPVGWTALIELDGIARTIRLTHPDARIDLGAVAKGFALDRAADILRACGVDDAILHAGTSSILAIGPVSRRIGVRAAGQLWTIDLRSASLCVSAPRGRIIGDNTHIIDPARGTSARSVDTSLVIAPGAGASSAAEADAWATALIVAASRPDAMPARLLHAIHDGRGWSPGGVPLLPLTEAA